jgi:putative transcriptional regulator
MSVIITLDGLLKKRGISSKELCALIGITEANLSVLRSGKAKAIRFSTLDKICYYLQCSPGDILSTDKKLGDENDYENDGRD